MSNQQIILIAAIGRNRELGKKGDLTWRLSSDLKRFKELTTGHPIIMGRKTYESIGRPLPNRTNIIVSRASTYAPDGCTVVHSFEAALAAAKDADTEKVFVIGGGEIYREALPFADTLALTRIDAEDPEADVFFPEFENEFEKVSEEPPAEENSIRYQWVTYARNT